MSKTFLALMAALAAASPVAAQQPGSRATREFVEAAGQSDMFEMLEAQTVLAQSSDPRLRAYAEQMLRDHEGTSRALRQATTRSGLKPPSTGIGDDQGRLLGALQNAKGTDFDKAYIDHQTLAHRSALTTAQRYAAMGDDAAFRRVADTTVPTISSHLAMIEQLRKMYGER